MTVRPTPTARPRAIEDALELIAASAADRDRAPAPRFPTEAIEALKRAGALTFNAARGATPPAR